MPGCRGAQKLVGSRKIFTSSTATYMRPQLKKFPKIFLANRITFSYTPGARRLAPKDKNQMVIYELIGAIVVLSLIGIGIYAVIKFINRCSRSAP